MDRPILTRSTDSAKILWAYGPPPHSSHVQPNRRGVERPEHHARTGLARELALGEDSAAAGAVGLGVSIRVRADDSASCNVVNWQGCGLRILVITIIVRTQPIV